MALVRFDVISDTHGYLSSELLEALQGANYIVHAGDITSNADYQTLQKLLLLSFAWVIMIFATTTVLW